MSALHEVSNTPTVCTPKESEQMEMCTRKCQLRAEADSLKREIEKGELKTRTVHGRKL